MKKIRRLLVLLFIFLFSFSLFSCNKDKTEEKVAPVYQGISIKKSLNKEEKLSENNSSNSSMRDSVIDWLWHGRHGENEEEYLPDDYNENGYENDIEKLVDLEVITDDVVRYYVNPSEEFIIQVALKNPSNYEIQSFTLNGKKYANYMFEAGSDMENLYLKVQAPENSGYTAYTVDAIKYIDGTEIKDVDLSSGEKTIKAGIKYENEPEAIVSNLTTDFSKASFNVRINDDSKLLNNKSKLYVSNGEKVVYEKQLELGNNHIDITNLSIDTAYQYMICAEYDLCDGNESTNHIMFKDDFKTKAPISFKNINVYNDYISFDYDMYDYFDHISYIAVYDRFNGNKLVKKIDSLLDLLISGLLSNHRYILYLEFDFNFGGSNYTDYIYYDFETGEKTEPTIQFKDFEITQNSVLVDYDIVDEDNVLNIEKVEVLNDAIVVDTLKDASKYEFNNLLSNKDYSIKLTYSYDLNDGNGKVTKDITKSFKTLTKSIPTVGVAISELSDKIISGNVVVSDFDNTYKLENIELYSSDNLISTANTNEFSFNIKSNSNYLIVVNYSYDLNEGDGVVSKTYSYSVATNKQKPEIEINTINMNDTSYIFDITETDNNNVGEIKSIQLYKGLELVRNISLTDYSVNELDPGTNYSLKVIYSYDLDDGFGQKTITKEKEFKTWNKAPIVDLETSVSASTINYVLRYQDSSNTFELTKVNLKKNDVSVAEKDLSTSTFDNLYSNNSYLLEVTYKYEIGEGEYKELTYQKEVKTLEIKAPVVGLSIDQVTVDKITGNVTLDDELDLCNVNSISLYQNDNLLTNISNEKEFSFDVKANGSYEIRVNYSYDLNDGEGLKNNTYKYQIQTGKEKPEFAINTVNVNDSSYVFDITEVDNNNVGEIKSIQLYKGLELVRNISLTDYSVNELDHGTNYLLKVIYSYDLDDGFGQKTITKEKEFKTWNKAPIIDLETNVNADSVSYALRYQDSSNTFELTKVNLKKNDVSVAEKDTLTNVFTNLYSNNSYMLEVTYKYEIGAGEYKELTYPKEIKTLEVKIPVVGLTINELTENKLNGNVTLDDESNVCIVNSVSLYQNDNLIANISNEKEFNFNVNANVSYEIRINYSYNLNDGEGLKNSTYKYQIQTGKQRPEFEIYRLSVDENSFVFDVNEIDNNNVGEIKTIRFYEGDSLVKSLPLTSYNVTDLNPSTTYKLEVVYLYDLDDGKGICSITRNIEFKTWNAKPVVDVTTNLTTTSIDYEVKYQDLSNTFELTKVYLKKNDVKVEEKDLLTSTFNNLYSNNSYLIEVTYKYEIGDGEYKELTYQKEVKTLEVKAPIVGLSIDEFTVDKISGNVTLDDELDLCSVNSVSLYQNDNLIDNINDKDFNFDVKANVSYEIRVNYSYDLNDGEGLKNNTYKYQIQTGKEKPDFEINKLSINENSFVFDITETDTNNVGEIKTIRLYQGENLIKNISLTSYNIDDLTSSTTYKLEVTYSYDLDDGKGVTTVIKELVFKTYNPTPTVDVETSLTASSVDYEVKYQDSSDTFELIKVNLKRNDVSVAEKDLLKSSFDNLYSNNSYLLEVTYKYELGEGEYKELTYQKEIKTLEIKAPTVGIAISELTVENIVGRITIDDELDLCNISSVQLYQEDYLIQNLLKDNQEFDFGVTANQSYTIVVNYSYDLNDGNGVVNTKVTKTVTTSKGLPVIKIIPYNITNSMFYYDLSINDSNSAGSLSSIRLYKDNNYVKDMSKYDTFVNGLNSNTEYEIIVIYHYNFNDGTGNHDLSYSYKFKTLKVEPQVSLTKDTLTKDSISINLNVTDVEHSLEFKGIELYKGTELIESSEEIINKFDNLLSDTNYLVVVKYDKDLNNGVTNYEKTLSFKTIAKTKPSVNINLTSDKTSVGYNYSILDSDNISEFKSVELYKDGVKLDNIANENKFDTLLSGIEYEVVVTLECDYNNGLGLKEETYSRTISTIAKVAPTVDLNFESSQTTINANIATVDNDNIINIEKVEVYKEDVLLKTITDLTNVSLEELTSNTIYTFKVLYNYNLNDGNDVVNGFYEEDYSTLAYNIEVKNYTILNDNVPKTDENISIKLDLVNTSQIQIDEIYVNSNKYEIVGGNNIDNIIFVIKAPKMSGDFNIDVQKFEYELNNFTVTQAVNQDLDIVVTVASRLGIVDIQTFDGSEIVNTSNPAGVVVKIDNPMGYKVLGCEIDLEGRYWNNSGTKYSNITIIDNNHFYLPISIYDSGTKNYRVISITYSIEGEKVVRNYNNTFSFNSTAVAAGENSAVVVNKISTPEEFLNMQSNRSYELINDIDMTGYEWNYSKAFSGYFNGMGHSIKNINVVIENEYTYNQTYGLFNSLSGTFKNVYFENMYCSIQSKGYINFYFLSNNLNAETSGIVYSGGINIDGADSTYATKYIFNSGIDKIIGSFKFNGESQYQDITVDYDTFNTTEFREETLGWKTVEKETSNYDGLQYTIIDNSYIFIEKYVGDGKTITVPEKIEGLPVVGISDLAFANNSNIERVELTADVIYYGGGILNGLSNLKSMAINELNIKAFGTVEYENAYKKGDYYLPKSLEEIEFLGNNVYLSGYTYVKKVILNDSITRIGDYSFNDCSSLTSVNIPTSVTSIGAYAFRSCTSLTSVNISESVTSIGYSAFYNCKLLTSVNIPENVTSIDGSTFYNCKTLADIIIPAKVTSIGNGAFEGCSSLKSVGSLENVTSIGEHAFNNCGSLKSVGSLENVTGIGDSAFFQCYSLINIGSLEKATSIGNWAFYNCKLLTSVGSMENVTNIGSNSFYQCHLLTSVGSLENIKSIGENAFGYCYALENILISNEVKSIEKSAFNSCNGLKSVYYNGTIDDWISISFGNEMSNPMSYSKNFYILDSNGDVEYNGNKYVKLTNVNISDKVSKIKNYAFYGFDNLENVYFDGTLAEWNNISFENQYSNPMIYADDLYVLDENGTVEYNGKLYKNSKDYNSLYTRVGNVIMFGRYPQKLETDDNRISQLNDLAGTLPVNTSNTYNWTWADNNRYYQDVDYDLDGIVDYRGIKLTYSYNSKYDTNTVYWFKYDMIKWDILSEEDGRVFVVSHLIIDSQRYNNNSNNYAFEHNGGTGYANNYELSDIRIWLNNTFYNTAFTDLQKQLIETTLVDNSASTTENSSNEYACNNTNDKVFLLSYKEYSANSLSVNRSDYRLCGNENYDNYWLRSPYYGNSTSVKCAGSYWGVTSYSGIRPAMWINLSTE